MVKTKTMIEAIEDTMYMLNFPCEWRIEWFKQKHMLELVVMIPVTFDEDTKVEDKYGMVNNTGSFIFEDALLLYDLHLAKIKDDNYIATIEFDEPDGLHGGTIEALCKNLRLTVGQAIAQLRDFKMDDDLSHFEMKWNQASFESTLKTLRDTGKFDHTIYAYPLEMTGEGKKANEVE